MIDDSGASNNRHTQSLEWLNLMHMLFIGVSALIALTSSFLPRMPSPSAQETLTESWFHHSDLQGICGDVLHLRKVKSLVYCSLWVVCSRAWRIACVIGFALSLSFCIAVSGDMSSGCTYWHRRSTIQSQAAHLLTFNDIMLLWKCFSITRLH